MTKKVHTKSAHRRLAGLEKLPPGAIMVTLWFLGIVLFLSFAMTPHVIASALAELYAGG